jgi:hypothetical protein
LFLASILSPAGFFIELTAPVSIALAIIAWRAAASRRTRDTNEPASR